jgi:hypothetical protein
MTLCLRKGERGRKLLTIKGVDRGEKKDQGELENEVAIYECPLCDFKVIYNEIAIRRNDNIYKNFFMNW